ncbi:MAG: hypothetical protein Q4Q23_03375 [Methanobacteriaceae archaeon]|nr:hypothetical protein [Methanobacteriaceae archaeon]
MLIEMISYALSGFFMKLSDDGLDEQNQLLYSILMGILCAIFTGLAVYLSSDATCVFISILVGNFLALKIDSINHIITALVFLVILLIIGVHNYSILLLIICIIAAFIDEIGNDKADKNELNNDGNLSLIDKFFKYRFTLKVVIFILSILGLINIFIPNFIDSMYCFNPMTCIYFFLFEICYILAEIFSAKIYGMLSHIF